MKSITPPLYAKAFLSVTRGKTALELDKLTAKFVEVIKNTGGWPRRRNILKQVDILWRREHKQPLITVESARPLSLSQENLLKKELGIQNQDYENKIDPTLIAGMRIQKEDRQIDGSLSHILKRLFSQLEI
ncbi:MAG: F0F1 ATP synthase subunit delta [bacterium]|nr:F0F1 ATP synthase subunit delta [bacterium]